MSTKAYIGDGVYADLDGFAVVLTTEDGISVQNRIVLEPEIVESLLLWLERVATAAAEREEGGDSA